MRRNQVMRIPVPGIENAFVFISARLPQDDSTTIGAEIVTTLVYDAGDAAAEWEPRFGPIQVWIRAGEDDPEGKDHYVWPKHRTPPGSWSQLAVEDNELPSALAEGNLGYIFAVLKRWAVA